jgi:hypothetical protein
MASPVGSDRKYLERVEKETSNRTQMQGGEDMKKRMRLTHSRILDMPVVLTLARLALAL